MMLTGMAGVLRDAGLKVVEVDGWKTRGHGAMTDVHGLTMHHNAGGRTTNPTAGLKTIVNGRSDLPGPLAHIYLARNGVWYVVAAGLCYHAGVSLKNDYTNPHRIGIEAQAAGDGWDEDWPDEQWDSAAIGVNALADHYGFDVEDVLGHKETCSPKGRKVDPSFSMSKFRDAVREADVFTSDDKKWLESKIRNIVLDVLNDEKPIRNIDGEGAVIGNMSFVRQAELDDQKQDRNNEKLDAILKLLTPAAGTAKAK